MKKPENWLLALKENLPEEGYIDTSHGSCHYLRWGSPGQPCIIFLHGASAHAYWYSPIAYNLRHDYQILSLSFPGHGKSSWQPSYNLSQLFTYIDTLYTLAQAPCMLVGHSFGGRVSLEYLRRFPEKLVGVCVLDPPGMKLPKHVGRKKAFLRTHTIRKSQSEILERFRLIPNQPLPDPQLCQFISENSIIEDQGGWRWQFDPNFFINLDGEGFFDPHHIECYQPVIPHHLLYGAHTTITTPLVRQSLQNLFPKLSESCTPHAWHALMLDQPIIIAEKLQNLANIWFDKT